MKKLLFFALSLFACMLAMGEPVSSKQATINTFCRHLLFVNGNTKLFNCEVISQSNAQQRPFCVWAHINF